MKAYRIIAHAIAGCVVLQATWIALSTFTIIHATEDGEVIDKNYDGNAGSLLHTIFGMGIIPILAIVLLIFSFFAGVPGGSKWAAYLFGVVFLQIVLAFVSFGLPAVGFLHGLNAFAVIGVAEIAARRASGVAGGPDIVPATA